MYATFANSGASVSGIFGASPDMLSLTAAGGFYQSPYGGDTAAQINCNVTDPSVRYDSYLTIGGDCAGQVSLSNVGFDFTAFNSGGGLISSNGIVYTMPGAVSGQAGTAHRVLLMQLTTKSGVKPTALFNLIGDNAVSGDQNEWYAFGMSIPNPVLVDCNSNGIHDAFDIANGTEHDCNRSGVPDSCEFSNPNADCDGDGILDICEIASGAEQDLNHNWILDDCECLGDVNGDGAVNVRDILEIIAAWGDSNPGRADLNGDGVVNSVDLTYVLQGWGSCL